jgi:hypothetical protein
VQKVEKKEGKKSVEKVLCARGGSLSPDSEPEESRKKRRKKGGRREVVKSQIGAIKSIIKEK